tara:strand:- start:926 stop:1195 length:270 start_codon:yes stop_codon:yes gene_type:complete
MKITRKQLRQLIKEEFSRLNEAVTDERGIVNNVSLTISTVDIEGTRRWNYELGYNRAIEDMGSWEDGERIPRIDLEGIVNSIKRELNKK